MFYLSIACFHHSNRLRTKKYQYSYKNCLLFYPAPNLSNKFSFSPDKPPRRCAPPPQIRPPKNAYEIRYDQGDITEFYGILSYACSSLSIPPLPIMLNSGYEPVTSSFVISQIHFGISSSFMFIKFFKRSFYSRCVL